METRKQILEKLIERATTIFGNSADNYSEDTKFEDLKMKSVNYSQMTTYLEDAFDVEIPYMEFKRKKTFGEAADYITELIEG